MTLHVQYKYRKPSAHNFVSLAEQTGLVFFQSLEKFEEWWEKAQEVYMIVSKEWVP